MPASLARSWRDRLSRGRRRGSFAGAALFFSFLLLAPAAPARAGSGPASLTADEVVMDYEARRLTATGDARLVYEGVEIAAERIEIDLNSDRLVATGGVLLKSSGESMRAETLVYDLGSGGGELGPFSGRIEDPGTGTALFFAGQGLSRTDELTTGSDLSLTTCDRAAPHYHFTAARVEYYPGDRIVLHRVFYWEGGLRLLYLPYLAISLKERSNGFRFPQVGYNETEGLFLKLAYDFFVGDNQSGTVLLDLMERKGVGKGLEYTWEFPAGSELTSLVYHLDNSLTGEDDYRFELGLKLPLEDLRLSGKIGYWQESSLGGADERTYKFGLEMAPRQGSGPRGTINYSFTDDLGPDETVLDVGVDGLWRLGKRSTLNLSGRWYRREEALLTERESYRMQYTTSWEQGRFLLLLQSSQMGSINTSGDPIADTYQILPELRLEFSRLDLGPKLGQFNLVLDYQHLVKENATIAGEGDRLAADLTASQRQLGGWGPFTLYAGGWARGRYYDTEEVIWGAAPTLTLATRLGEAWTFQSVLAWIESEGAPPALWSGDTLTPRGNLSLSANYRRNRWQGRMATNYAFLTERWEKITANLSWNSQDGDLLNFSTSYDPMEGVFGLTSLAVGWRPKQDWQLRLNTSYNPEVTADPWRLDLMAQIKQGLGEKFAINLNVRYDLFQEDWVTAKAVLEYIWHCRTVSLGYDWANEEINLTIWITGFPQYPLKIAYSESGFFYTPPFVLP